ncbi:hypothetical protein GOODEAATRI_007876 [Goodea atripinnis]|uniref:Uncharacterized protein n=1 Tax=Goodea atripinnis TaxID=208336 RepID=A0ABV0PWQ3_9TELE
MYSSRSKQDEAISTRRFPTCHASRVSKDYDVIQCPAVLGVWWVKSKLTGGLFPQIHQVCGVDHRHSETAPTFPSADGHVGRSSLVVTLKNKHTNTVWIN